MRRWSWKLGEVSGIGIYVHATFLLIIGWVVLSHLMQGIGLLGTLAGVGFILTLFGCVVLHELGHSLTAKRFGIKTRDITLLPIGGVARLERMPEDPKQELWVTLAGPAINIAIAGLLFVFLQLTGGLGALGALGLTGGSFLQRLMVVNLFLAGFNLLPAFPMDGGRVLRALLATRMDYARATQIAATLGQGMAIVFGILGFFINPFMILIAFFIWSGAAQEAKMVRMKSTLGGVSVERAMQTDFATLSPYDSTSQVIKLILAGSQKDFPVVENGEVVGILTRRDLMVALAKRGQGGIVADIMQRDFQTLDLSDPLETVLTRMQSGEVRTIPVTQYGRLIGILTADNVDQFLMIQAALRRKGMPFA